MLALLQNELVLYAIIVGLVAAFIIGRFIGFFTGSGERAQAAKAKTAKATTATTATTAKSTE